MSSQNRSFCFAPFLLRYSQAVKIFLLHLLPLKLCSRFLRLSSKTIYLYQSQLSMMNLGTLYNNNHSIQKGIIANQKNFVKNTIDFLFFTVHHNIQQMKANLIPTLLTTKGEITAQQLSTLSIVIFHEKLTPLVHPISSGKPLMIEYVDFHRENLLSVENTSVTSGLIDHQLQLLLGRIGKSSSEVLILDSSNYESPVPEIFQKYTVVKGYQYKISNTVGQAQKMVLLGREHVSKQIQYQFKLGNGQYRPGFIGEIPLGDFHQDSPYYQTTQAYLQFSAKTNCLILVNASELGSKCVIKITKSNQSIQYEEEKKVVDHLRFIEHFSKLCILSKVTKVVLFNIPLLFETKVDESNFSFLSSNPFHNLIISLFESSSILFGFDISKYRQSQEALIYLALLLKKFPKRVILTAGLSYKTSLSAFGGTGFLLYEGVGISDLVKYSNQKLVKDAMVTNKVQLLLWNNKAEEIKVILSWKCNQCGKQQPQTIDSFRKFGKQFCGIKCLKSHQF